jgi:hypothetical protein
MVHDNFFVRDARSGGGGLPVVFFSVAAPT